MNRFYLYFFALVSLHSSCPFCDPAIIKNESILETENAIVFGCITPATKNHVLVVPKRHVLALEELTDEEASGIHALISQMAKVFKDFYCISDYLVVLKNGKLAGQSQSHIHFHMIPCDERMVGMDLVWHREAIEREQVVEYCREIRRLFEK